MENINSEETIPGCMEHLPSPGDVIEMLGKKSWLVFRSMEENYNVGRNDILYVLAVQYVENSAIINAIAINKGFLNVFVRVYFGSKKYSEQLMGKYHKLHKCRDLSEN